MLGRSEHRDYVQGRPGRCTLLGISNVVVEWEGRRIDLEARETGTCGLTREFI